MGNRVLREERQAKIQRLLNAELRAQNGPFPLGPFVLARAVGMPMLPAFCLLEADYRYTVRVVEPLAVARGGEEEAARAWVAVLENVVREYPTQWFNFFDVWNPWSGEPARPGGRIPTGTGARR